MTRETELFAKIVITKRKENPIILLHQSQINNQKLKMLTIRTATILFPHMKTMLIPLSVHVTLAKPVTC